MSMRSKWLIDGVQFRVIRRQRSEVVEYLIDGMPVSQTEWYQRQDAANAAEWAKRAALAARAFDRIG